MLDANSSGLGSASMCAAAAGCAVRSTQCANISTVNEDRPTELGLRLHSALRHRHARARNLVYARVGV
jgi:hypothetical protein